MKSASDQLDLPPLRTVIENYNIAAKKSLGQNFLLDLNLTGRIARVAGDFTNHPVLEIGPGPGGLTRAILSQNPQSLTVIEPDKRCLPALAQIGEHYPDKLKVIEADALKIDSESLFDESYHIIANLPYNVGTQLLLNWLTISRWPPNWLSLTLMFQKEVAERIVAGCGDKSYGRVSVLAGWRTNRQIAFQISPKAFFPPPKVTSAVVHLTPKEHPIPCDLETLERVTSAAFGQRRKMLRASLKSLGGATLLNKVNIDPTRRAETLDVQEFVALANAL